MSDSLLLSPRSIESFFFFFHQKLESFLGKKMESFLGTLIIYLEHIPQN
jgi:hypothetical protein